jgi:hypothetical protein
MFRFVDRPEKVAWAFVVVAIVVAVGGFLVAHSDRLDPLVVRFGLDTLSRDFYANVVVELQGARLEHVRFPVRAVRVNLRDADLSHALLAGTDLSYALLEGAILDGVDLSTATLAGAEYSVRTRWPAGFDPVAKGVVMRG